MRRIALLAAAAASSICILPLAAQNGTPDQALIERRVIVADFETESEGWRLRTRRPDDGNGIASLATLSAPPVASSERTLYVSFQGSGGAGFRLQTEAPLRIRGHVIQISLWVYGAGRLDELSLLVRDRRGDTQQLALGRLDFRGWRQLHCRIPSTVEQRPLRLSESEDSGLEVLAIQLRLPPGASTVRTEFSVDQMTALIRDPHRRPAPDWNL